MDSSPGRLHHARGLLASARLAFALLPDTRARVLWLTLLGVATSVVDTIAVGLVLLLLQLALGSLATVDGYGALGFVANLAHRLAACDPWLVGGTVLAILAAQSLLAAIHEALTANLRLQAYQTFRERVFATWMAADLHADGRYEPGRMVHTIQNLTWEAADAVFHLCSLAVAAVIAAAYVAVMGATSLALTATAGAMAAVAVLAVSALRRRLWQRSQASIEQKEVLARHFLGNLTALRTVKAFRGETEAVQTSRRLSSSLRRTFESITALETRIRLVTDASNVGVLSAVLLVALRLGCPGTVVLGFVIVLYRAQPRFVAVYQALARLARAQPSLALIAEHLADAPAPRPDGKAAFPGCAREIRLRGVRFAYPGGPPVLHDVDLVLAKGAMTVLLGRSGAGKSTVVGLLLRFLEPTAGAVLCDDVAVATYTRASWLGRVAAAGQDVELLDGTVRENLRMGGPDATDGELWRALELADAAEIVHGLPRGLDAEVGTRGVRLSGGQRQRLCLARALLVDADLLVLDEATNAVDAVMELAIYQRIRAARPHLTMLVVAHRAAVGAVADHVVVLADGRVAESGTPDALLRAGGTFAALAEAAPPRPVPAGRREAAPERVDAGRAEPPPAVAVVVPAYNAGRTLAATLASVVAQTFTDFEVILVDDGSTDATSAIAAEFAARDRRIQVVTKPNTGVADARNAGIRRARARLIAPIDADDVWHPECLEKLYAALRAAGDDALFAFANHREIDLRDRVLRSAPRRPLAGRVFHRFLLKNFVGNGSGMLFRRDAALAVGGYERRLQHDFDAPGCEDWLLQMRLAARGRVAVVDEHLVGYRRVPGSMSDDPVRMCRSRIHAFEILFGEIDCRRTDAARWGLGRALAECALRELLAGNVVAALRLLPSALARDAVGTLHAAVEGGVRGAQRLLHLVRRADAAPPFAACDPGSDGPVITRGLLARRLARAALLDAAVPSPPGAADVAPMPLPARVRRTGLGREHA
jgi:ABC-type multidrug transport system fused ATPase/permease subunit